MSTSKQELSYITGDLFAAPANSILVQACNTKGSWGAGIALEFKTKYPAQFEQYREHCREHGDGLIGSCLLIPGDKHDIACLFTSKAYGRRKDSPSEILSATRTSVQDLIRRNTDNKPLHAWYVPSPQRPSRPLIVS
jgi:ADP-ribose 1''-phosphate phosphatase